MVWSQSYGIRQSIQIVGIHRNNFFISNRGKNQSMNSIRKSALKDRELLQLFTVPKNLESGNGPSLSLSLIECLALDLCLLSFFDFLDLDFELDLFDSLSSSLLEDPEDELEELASDDLRLCCKIHLKY